MPIKKKNIFLIFICLFFVATGFKCKLQSPNLQEAMEPVELEYWGVFNDSDSFKGAIRSYQEMHPNVSIKYKKFRYDEYRDKILQALAEDRGPDILSIHNTWLGEYKSKIEPMPDKVKIPFQEVKGKIKKEVTISIKEVPSISLLRLKNDFVEVVSEDCVSSFEGEQKIMCLPLSMDSLALYYNKDLLNIAGIPVPPKTWTEFQDYVKRITKYDSEQNIAQSAAALGTTDNVERFSDILTLLMMQNGAVMSDGNKVLFHQASGRDKYLPALQALKFYKAFADPLKDIYTWNDEMPNSLEAFVQGKTAFFFGYSYHLPIIKARSPKLNFSITNAPQIVLAEDTSSSVNIANYWVETVSRKSENTDIAWNFIQYMATDTDIISKYLEKTKKPTALRALISSQLDDFETSPFASQVLTAKSWYKGKSSGAMEEIFADMVDNVSSAVDDKACQKEINTAAVKIQQTY